MNGTSECVNGSTTDGAEAVARSIRRDLSLIEDDTDPIYSALAPARLVYCVLSRCQQSREYVRRQADEFIVKHPEISTCAALLALIRAYPTPAEFARQELHINASRRAQALVGIVDYANAAQRRYTGHTEAERLAAWAASLKPKDVIRIPIRGFALVSFQHLRMLFGVDTVMPDKIIVRYISAAIGRRVSPMEAVQIAERTASMVGLSARAIDNAIRRYGSSDQVTQGEQLPCAANRVTRAAPSPVCRPAAQLLSTDPNIPSAALAHNAAQL